MFSHIVGYFGGHKLLLKYFFDFIFALWQSFHRSLVVEEHLLEQIFKFGS